MSNDTQIKTQLYIAIAINTKVSQFSLKELQYNQMINSIKLCNLNFNTNVSKTGVNVPTSLVQGLSNMVIIFLLVQVTPTTETMTEEIVRLNWSTA